MSAVLGNRASGKGEPLLLLNGALMSLAAWQPVVTSLEGSYRIVRCDFRGQLFSQGEPQKDLDAHVADVIRLLDHLQIGRTRIAGASFGSLVGLRLAARHPERVAALAAITSTNHVVEESWKELEPVWQACLDAAAGGDGGLVSDTTLTMFSDRYRETQEEMLSMQREWISMLPPIWFKGVAAILETVKGLDLRQDLPAVRCPVLVVGAEEDNVFPPPHSQALAAALPGSRLEMLPSGHSVVVEQPGRLAEVLRPFLSQAR
jgi:3-oxoadipate enol-lactonase